MKMRLLGAGLGLACGLTIALTPEAPPVIKAHKAENTILEHRLRDLETAAGIRRNDWTYALPAGMEMIVELQIEKNGDWTAVHTWTVNDKDCGTSGVMTVKVSSASVEAAASEWAHSIQAVFQVSGEKNGHSFATPERITSREQHLGWGEKCSNHLGADEIINEAKRLWELGVNIDSHEIKIFRATVTLRRKSAGK